MKFNLFILFYIIYFIFHLMTVAISINGLDAVAAEAAASETKTDK